MRANKPSKTGIKVTTLMAKIKENNDRVRYSEKSIVKKNLLTFKLAGKIVLDSFGQLVWL